MYVLFLYVYLCVYECILVCEYIVSTNCSYLQCVTLSHDVSGAKFYEQAYHRQKVEIKDKVQ